MTVTLKFLLNYDYSESQAQKILNNFHQSAPKNTRSYRVFDGEKDNGGKVVRVVRRRIK